MPHLLAPLLTALLACAPPPSPDAAADTAASDVLTVAALRAGEGDRGYVDLVDLRVVSGLTADGLSAYLQDRATGEGAELRLGTLGVASLPPVGTPITLRAYYEGGARAPVLWLAAPGDLVVAGPPEDPVVAVDPAEPRPLDLVRYSDVTVTSQPDPTGAADTSLGRALDGRFGVVLPELGNRGALTGVVTADGPIAPRTDDDWVGPRAPAPVRDATVADVLAGDVPAGAVVRLDVLQAAPWSRDGRATVVQDAAGLGLWLDVEAFGHARTGAGDRLTLYAEVRGDDGQRWLRSWWPATVTGTGEVVARTSLNHGLLIDVEVSGVGRPGWVGERTTDQGWLLDDRFLDLTALTDVPGEIPVRAAVDASGPTLRLAVVALR